MTKIFQLLNVVMLAAIAGGVFAQETPGEDSSKKQPVAHVRCWIFPRKENDAVTVVAKSADKTEHQLAAAKGAAVSPVGYGTLPAGTYVFEARFGGSTASSPAFLLKDGSYCTLAAVPKGNSWELIAYPDGLQADKSAPRPVRVFNFAGGRKTVLHPGDAKPSEVPSGSVAEIKLPASLTPLRVEVPTLDGKGAPALSTVELDLKRWPSGYVVVSPDYRGRMRPRVLPGGEEPEIASP